MTTKNQTNCPYSKLKHISQSIFKKQVQTKITRKTLESKLKNEESFLTSIKHKFNYKINRTVISDEDKLFGHYCASELLTNLWETTKIELEDFEEKKVKLISYLSNSQDLTNIGSTQRQNTFINLADKLQSVFLEIHNRWDSQFTQISQKPISELTNLELCYRLRNSQDRLFGNGIIENTIKAEIGQDRLEIFYPLITEPNLTAQNLDDVIKNTIKNLSKDANNHQVHSTSRFNSLLLYLEEHNLSGKNMLKHFSIYEKTSNSLINNPEITKDTDLIVGINLEKDFRAHTKNFYGCPALHIKTENSKDSIFKELIQYKLNFFKDVYLALETNKSDSFVNNSKYKK